MRNYENKERSNTTYLKDNENLQSSRQIHQYSRPLTCNQVHHLCGVLARNKIMLHRIRKLVVRLGYNICLVLSTNRTSIRETAWRLCDNNDSSLLVNFGDMS
jgi:hypothetical protein